MGPRRVWRRGRRPALLRQERRRADPGRSRPPGGDAAQPARFEATRARPT
jgi:hypothetical protein